jgi:hypothetical protein
MTAAQSSLFLESKGVIEKLMENWLLSFVFVQFTRLGVALLEWARRCPGQFICTAQVMSSDLVIAGSDSLQVNAQFL